jgi:hypothetical protein
MAQKWNLQDIRPAEHRRRAEKSAPSAEARPLAQNRDETPLAGSIDDKNRGRRYSYYSVLGLALLLVGGGFVISIVFAKTTLTVQPEFHDLNIDAEFVAYPERRDNALAYEVMTLEMLGERQLTAVGQREVEEQARGYLEIVKTTPGNERLIKNTRFRSPQGLIFRIQESVVVPGAARGRDGTLVPGTVRAEVFAEQAGDQYNLPAETRFNVPAFEEGGLTELYETIYAVNRQPFTGGFAGPQFIIDDGELSAASQSLQAELQNTLRERVKNERPAGFVAFTDSFAFTYTTLPPEQIGQNLVNIRKQAVLQIPLFEASELARFIARETVPAYGGQPMRIVNPDTLSFAYQDPNHSAAILTDLPSIAFTLGGETRLVFEYDAEKLRQELAGKNKAVIEQVLANYAGIIRSAQVSTKPFWRRSFPTDPSRIIIIETLAVDSN